MVLYVGGRLQAGPELRVSLVGMAAADLGAQVLRIGRILTRNRMIVAMVVNSGRMATNVGRNSPILFARTLQICS